MLLSWFRARMSRALNKFCHAGRASTSPSSMSCQCWYLIDRTFLQLSNSHQSPVPNREHTCGCLAMITVREPFFTQFPSSERVRSMKSVSSAILKAEKTGVWQTPETLCDGFQASYRYQESRCRTSKSFCQCCQSCEYMGHS